MIWGKKNNCEGVWTGFGNLGWQMPSQIDAANLADRCTTIPIPARNSGLGQPTGYASTHILTTTKKNYYSKVLRKPSSPVA